MKYEVVLHLSISSVNVLSLLYLRCWKFNFPKGVFQNGSIKLSQYQTPSLAQWLQLGWRTAPPWTPQLRFPNRRRVNRVEEILKVFSLCREQWTYPSHQKHKTSSPPDMPDGLPESVCDWPIAFLHEQTPRTNFCLFIRTGHTWLVGLLL